jgi:PelA/Pel-15E family pectate lyase
MKTLLACLVLIFSALTPTLASVETLLGKPADWFASDEARRAGHNVLAWQTENGDWPKNVDTTSERSGPLPPKGTFDNGATTGELRFLAKLFQSTKDPQFERAFLKGLDLVLRAQYPNGGWPQSFPPGSGYARHITYNDNTFVRLAEFARDISKSPDFRFVSDDRRQAAAAAYERAIACVVRSQIRVDGELTVWCAQHDAETLEPRPARTYELVSLSGAESARLLSFLMDVDRPSPALRESIEAGVKWFERSKIRGLRQVRENGERRMIPDENAPPLWARFYEIETNRPIFSGRDGVKRYSIDEIEAERRNGYAWYGEWGSAVQRRYADWKRSI